MGKVGPPVSKLLRSLFATDGSDNTSNVRKARAETITGGCKRFEPSIFTHNFTSDSTKEAAGCSPANAKHTRTKLRTSF